MFNIKIEGYSLNEIISHSGLKAREMREVFSLIESDIRSEKNDDLYSFKIINHIIYNKDIDVNTMKSIFNFTDFRECLELSSKFKNINEQDVKSLFSQMAKQNTYISTKKILVDYKNINLLISQGFESEEEEYIRAVKALDTALKPLISIYESTIDARETQAKAAAQKKVQESQLHRDLVKILEKPLRQAKELIEAQRECHIDGVCQNIATLQRNLSLRD